MVARIGKVGDIKVGRYVIIEGAPCEVVSVKKEVSPIGMEKLAVAAIGILDGKERSFTAPLDSECEFLVVEIKNAQILAADNENVHPIDMRTGKRFQVKKPRGIESELKADTQVEYIGVMGIPKLTKMGLQNIHSYA